MLAVAGGALAAAGGPTPAALAGLAGYFTAGLLYEFVHYYVHLPVTPTSAAARALRNHHTLHHLHNEAYWLAFTLPALDRVFGRAPRPSSVPRGRLARAARAARAGGRGAGERG